MIDECDIVVRVLNLPIGTKGFVTDSPDGVHNIYLNARYPFETRLKTYHHELRHIRRFDYESDRPISELEA